MSGAKRAHRFSRWGGGLEAARRGDAAVSADAIGERSRADPAGIHIRAARHSTSAA